MQVLEYISVGDMKRHSVYFQYSLIFIIIYYIFS